jgi:ArsR family transcriptional regulator
MNKKYIMQARIFKAMSDENRLKILELLNDKPCNATELLGEMDFGQSTLSHHMKILIRADIVKSSKSGKWVTYSLKTDVFEEMISWMEQYLEKEPEPQEVEEAV